MRSLQWGVNGKGRERGRGGGLSRLSLMRKLRRMYRHLPGTTSVSSKAGWGSAIILPSQHGYGDLPSFKEPWLGPFTLARVPSLCILSAPWWYLLLQTGSLQKFPCLPPT